MIFQKKYITFIYFVLAGLAIKLDNFAIIIGGPHKMTGFRKDRREFAFAALL